MAARRVGKLKQAAVRALRGAVVRYARGAGRSDPEEPDAKRVYILMMHAWGMGGTIRTALNVAGHLAKDHEVEVLSMVRRADEPFFPFPPGVKVTAVDDGRPGATPAPLRAVRESLSRLPSRLLPEIDSGAHRAVSLWTDVRLARLFRSRRTGILITTRPGLNLLALNAAPPTLVKVGQEHMNFSAHRPLVKRAIKRQYPHLDGLVVLTEHDREEYTRMLGETVPVARIPNAVPPLDGPTSDLTAKTVLAAGRLMRQKDFGRLIRAFDLVRDKHPDWTLRICGRGPRHGALKALIADRGLEERVVLAGAVPNLGEEMANASMLAMSSRFEGFPMVLLEAMSKGLPVASFDVPTGPRDIIDDRQNGLLVAHQDVPALAAAIVELIEDEELRRRCGAGALETAERYKMAVIGPQWERLLADLVEERRVEGQ